MGSGGWVYGVSVWMRIFWGFETISIEVKTYLWDYVWVEIHSKCSPLRAKETFRFWWIECFFLSSYRTTDKMHTLFPNFTIIFSHGQREKRAPHSILLLKFVHEVRKLWQIKGENLPAKRGTSKERKHKIHYNVTTLAKSVSLKYIFIIWNVQKGNGF